MDITIQFLGELAHDRAQAAHLKQALKLENVYKMHEEFLDKAFGERSRLDKDVWLAKVASKECRWIFRPEEMRKYAGELLSRAEETNRVAEKPESLVLVKNKSSSAEKEVDKQVG